MKNVN